MILPDVNVLIHAIAGLHNPAVRLGEKILAKPKGLLNRARHSEGTQVGGTSRRKATGTSSDACASKSTPEDSVTDAWLTVLAIEWGCEWITFDRDYARFPGLKWQVPMA